MPNGGSDCCGTCWFNRANEDRSVPSHCEIRDLDIPVPFYTYCANHPHHRPERDPIPIGPVYTGDNDGNREVWQASPDSEEIRQHLLKLVRRPEPDKGYHFFTAPAHIHALQQLIDWEDERLIGTLEELADSPEIGDARSTIQETISLLRERFGRPDAT